jgi:hypothetical protein
MNGEYSVEGSGTTPIMANGKRGEDRTVDSSTLYTGPTRSYVDGDDDELDNSTFYSGEDVTLDDRDNDEIIDDLELGRMSEDILDNLDLLCSREIFMGCGEEDEPPQTDVYTPVSVKGRLRSSASRHSAKESFVEIMLDAKEKDESEQSKSGLSSHRIIRSPSQDELRAIYENISTVANTKPSLLSKAKSSNGTVSPFRRQKRARISPSAEPDYWSDEIHAFASPTGDTELIFRERMEADIVFTRTEGRTLILI